MKKPWTSEALMLAAILACGAVLRAVHLNDGLWYDEIVTLVSFVRLPAADLLTTYGSLNNHLLYTWLAKATAFVFGEVPWAVRLPAAAFGVASIWACWRLVRDTKLAGVALATAALLAVSYHHVWFSQNARGYTGMLLFTSLAAVSMARGLRDGRAKNWMLYSLFAAAALVTHLTSAFLLVAQGLVALGFGYREVFVLKRAQLQRWLKWPATGFGGAVALALIVYAPMLPGMIETFTAYHAPVENIAATGVKEWKSPVWTLLETMRSFGPIGAVLPIAFAFALLGAYRLTRLSPMIALPYLVHIPLTLVILLVASFRIWPRYFLIDIGFLIACMVAGAFWFAEIFVNRTPSKFRFGLEAQSFKIAGAALMIAASVPLLLHNYTAPKQDFEGAYAFVEQQRAQFDQIVTIGLADYPYSQYLAPQWSAAQSRSDLEALVQLPGRVWVVTAFPAHTHSNFPEMSELLTTKFDVVKQFHGTLSGGDIIVYRSREP